MLLEKIQILLKKSGSLVFGDVIEFVHWEFIVFIFLVSMLS